MDAANNHAPLNTGAQPVMGNGNVLSCVVEAIELLEDVNGSQEDFLNKILVIVGWRCNMTSVNRSKWDEERVTEASAVEFGENIAANF